MQLVPFGEYVPFQSVLFFVQQVVQAVGNLGAGTVPTVFKLPDAALRHAHLLRGRVPGAHPPVRRTTERTSWSTSRTTPGSAGPRRPTSTWRMDTFRAIENRVPFVRAANTGISAVIDADGHIRWQGPLFEMLWHVDDIGWTGVRTVYTRYGDVFVWACVGATLAAIAWGLARPRRA